jgi:proline iminopeptidase
MTCRSNPGARLARAAVLAAALCAPPAAGAQAPPRPPVLADGEREVVIHGVRHWVKVAGARHRTTPLVVVHGGPGGNVYNFERRPGPDLERFATVVYYEQRGSGRSAAPADSNAYSTAILVADLDALRDSLGAGRIVPVGFSYGGELALEYALAHPARVERVVVSSPSTGEWERMMASHLDGFRAVTLGAAADSVARIARDTAAPLAERWERAWAAVDQATVDRFLFHGAEAAAWNRRLWRESRLANTGAMFRALRRAPPPALPLRDRLRALRVPALFLEGLWDRNVGVDEVRNMAQATPGARFVVFRRSAHFPDIEEPAAWVRAVRGFTRGR